MCLWCCAVKTGRTLLGIRNPACDSAKAADVTGEGVWFRMHRVHSLTP